MFSIRDSVEPEDPFEDADVFPSPTHVLITDASPITFDLPSTTSAQTQLSSTSLPLQKSQAPDTASAKRLKRRTVDDEGTSKANLKEDMWDFSIDSPGQSVSTMDGRVNKNARRDAAASIETPPSVRTMRRNSMNTGTGKAGTGRNRRCSSVGVLNESPTISRKRKLTKRIEESDSEEDESHGKGFQSTHQDAPAASGLDDSTQLEVEKDTMTAANLKPRKRAIAVVIPVRRNTTPKVPLQEINVENVSAPDTTEEKAAQHIEPKQRSPEPLRPSNGDEHYEHDLENVVPTEGSPASPVRAITHEQTAKMATTMSPPRPMNVASILAKSPSRPIYRVGLSKRVNIEPLHAYLKKKTS